MYAFNIPQAIRDRINIGKVFICYLEDDDVSLSIPIDVLGTKLLRQFGYTDPTTPNLSSGLRKNSTYAIGGIRDNAGFGFTPWEAAFGRDINGGIITEPFPNRVFLINHSTRSPLLYPDQVGSGTFSRPSGEVVVPSTDPEGAGFNARFHRFDCPGVLRPYLNRDSRSFVYLRATQGVHSRNHATSGFTPDRLRLLELNISHTSSGFQIPNLVNSPSSVKISPSELTINNNNILAGRTLITSRGSYAEETTVNPTGSSGDLLPAELSYTNVLQGGDAAGLTPGLLSGNYPTSITIANLSRHSYVVNDGGVVRAETNANLMEIPYTRTTSSPFITEPTVPTSAFQAVRTRESLARIAVFEKATVPSNITSVSWSASALRINNDFNLYSTDAVSLSALGLPSGGTLTASGSVGVNAGQTSEVVHSSIALVAAGTEVNLVYSVRDLTGNGRINPNGSNHYTIGGTTLNLGYGVLFDYQFTGTGSREYQVHLANLRDGDCVPIGNISHQVEDFRTRSEINRVGACSYTITYLLRRVGTNLQLVTVLKGVRSGTSGSLLDLPSRVDFTLPTLTLSIAQFLGGN
jgi:hypothetical protein